MTKTPKRIINITEEKLDKLSDIPSDTIPAVIEYTHKNLLNEFTKAEIYKEDTPDKDLIFPDIIKKQNTYTPHIWERLKQNSYDHDLRNALEYIDDLFTTHETEKVSREIDALLLRYKWKLTKKDIIQLLLKKMKIFKDNNNLSMGIHMIQQLATYEENFDQEGKNIYYYLKGVILFNQGSNFLKAYNHWQAHTSFIKALESFDTIRNQGALLETDFYKRTMFYILLCTYKLDNINECLQILSEIHSIPNEHNTDNTSDDRAILNSQIFYVQWLVYERIKDRQKAIDSFKKCLTYDPTQKEEILQRIRRLSEKSGE